MTIEELTARNILDHYKDRTGDYGAKTIPKASDFTSISRRTVPPISIAKYGLTRWQYWRLQDKQNGRCAICGELPNGRALHVDHCHDSKTVRALICHGCNIAIGMIKED